MEKKFLIPVILGVMLLCGIVFTIVYKKTDGNIGKEQPVIETLAPKETKEVETRVVGENTLKDFEVNEAKSLDELSGGKVFVYNSELEEVLDTETKLDEEVIKSSETLSDEEINKIVQEQIELQTARPYNSENDTEMISEEERESIEAETESDLSKYEMDTSYLDDPERVQEILEKMGY